MNGTSSPPPVMEPDVVGCFVEKLGRALLKQATRDWTDMDTASEICRAHSIRLNETCLTRSELEAELRAFFQERGEFYAPGVNLDGFERRVGWDLLFMIRAYPYRSICPTSSTVEDGGATGPGSTTLPGHTPDGSKPEGEKTII